MAFPFPEWSLPSLWPQIYRVYSNNQEYEVFRLQESLQSVPNETRMIVRLGRALLPGEFRIKLSLLRIDEVEVSWLSRQRWSLSNVHWCSISSPSWTRLLPRAWQWANSRRGLWKKLMSKALSFPCNWTGKRRAIKFCLLCVVVYVWWIFQNTSSQEDLAFTRHGVSWPSNFWEGYSCVCQLRDVCWAFGRWGPRRHQFCSPKLRVCVGEDPMTLATQMQVYVRRWRPSVYKIDKTAEIILDENSFQHLKLKLFELSGIPINRIQFAKVRSNATVCNV